MIGVIYCMNTSCVNYIPSTNLNLNDNLSTEYIPHVNHNGYHLINVPSLKLSITNLFGSGSTIFVRFPHQKKKKNGSVF